MHTPICKQPSSVVPAETPVAMKTTRVKRSLGRWAKPQIVVNAGRCAAVRHLRCGASIFKESPGLNLSQFSYPASLYERYGVLPMLTTALLLSHLHNSFIFSRGIQHRFTFVNRIRQWFLSVNILACFAC